MGQHSGRDELTGSGLINEDYEAGFERHSIKDLDNMLELDQRSIKRAIHHMLQFKLFRTAQRTVVGSKAMDMLKKGQLAGGDGHKPSLAKQVYSLAV